MRRKKFAFLAILLTAFLFSSCTPLPQKGTYIQFTDSVGETVYLDQKPQRTAVLFSSFAEIWVLAGGECAVTVGESIERGLVPEDTPTVDGGAGKTVNTELLLSLAPELVILNADIAAQVKAAEILRAADVPCALLRVESFEDYLNTLKLFTDILGTPDNYEKYGKAVKDDVDLLLATFDAGKEKGPDILFIRSGASASSAKAKRGGDHFAAAMLDELGAHNIADDAPILLDGLSLEAVLRSDPQIIFITLMGNEAGARAYVDGLLASPPWQKLTAVREGRVVFLPRELFQYKPNARWADAYEFLTNALTP